MLTLIKRFIQPDWNLCFFLFFFPCVIDICQVPGYVFFIVFHVSRRSIPMDVDEPLLLVRISEKSSLEARKEGRREFTRACFVRMVRCTFPEAVLHTLEFLIRESLTLWNSRCVRSALPVCPDENGHNSSTRNPPNASAVYRKADTVIGYWIIPSVRYNTEKR